MFLFKIPTIASIIVWLLIVAALCAAAPAPTLARSPIVKTSNGDIQGSIGTSFLVRRTYYSFRGIPYAQPPIGQLRFKVSRYMQTEATSISCHSVFFTFSTTQAPRKLEPWSGVLNASEYGANCLQTTFTLTDFRGAEDCLFLNVFTPSECSIDPNVMNCKIEKLKN